MIDFVGAGSGAADLITVRGKRLLEEADVIIYAGSLVNPELLNYKKEGCEVYNSAYMTLEEVLEVMKRQKRRGSIRSVFIREIPVFTVRYGNRWTSWTGWGFPMNTVPA